MTQYEFDKKMCALNLEQHQAKEEMTDQLEQLNFKSHEVETTIQQLLSKKSEIGRQMESAYLELKSLRDEKRMVIFRIKEINSHYYQMKQQLMIENHIDGKEDGEGID